MCLSVVPPALYFPVFSENIRYLLCDIFNSLFFLKCLLLLNILSFISEVFTYLFFASFYPKFTMAAVAGYRPKAYVLVLYPQTGGVYITNGVRSIPIDDKEDLPIVVPLKPQHWCNAFWKTDVCAGKFSFSSCDLFS